MYQGPWSGGDTYRNPGPVACADEIYAPVPGWGMEPNLAGPRRLAVGGTADDVFFGGALVILGLVVVTGLVVAVRPGGRR